MNAAIITNKKPKVVNLKASLIKYLKFFDLKSETKKAFEIIPPIIAALMYAVASVIK